MKISDADNNSCLLPREEKSSRHVAVYVVAKFLDDNKTENVTLKLKNEFALV